MVYCPAEKYYMRDNKTTSPPFIAGLLQAGLLAPTSPLFYDRMIAVRKIAHHLAPFFDRTIAVRTISLASAFNCFCFLIVLPVIVLP